jgi:5-amino-6-(5-phosphoribosylamino)uracil reductase
LPEYPLKVTVTASGDLSAGLKFWHHGGDKAVYCPDHAVGKLRAELGGLATIIGTGELLDLRRMLADLAERGVGQLMVEGGSTIHTEFLAEGLADEIHLAIAPFFVGQPGAPRFVEAGSFPNDRHHRMQLIEARPVGDVALLRYRPKAAV